MCRIFRLRAHTLLQKKTFHTRILSTWYTIILLVTIVSCRKFKIPFIQTLAINLPFVNFEIRLNKDKWTKPYFLKLNLLLQDFLYQPFRKLFIDTRLFDVKFYQMSFYVIYWKQSEFFILSKCFIGNFVPFPSY